MEHVRIVSRGMQYCKEGEGCRECPTSCQSACKTSCTVGTQMCRREEKKE
jgi:predicted ribosomally synthesized six-cysteine peptide SCIFF